MDESTRRRERDIVKVLHFAIITCIPPVAVCRNTPSEVEVSSTVEERGSEAEDEDVEEPAQFPMLPPFLDLNPQLAQVNGLVFY